MIHAVVRQVVFPIVAFAGMVSVGFAAWAFQDSAGGEDEVQGTVYVTALATPLGEVVINPGEGYTEHSQYYTLVFSEDQTLDEKVGVTLHPSIEYTFFNFPELPDDYGYFVNYRAEYLQNSIFAKYAEIVNYVDSGTLRIDYSTGDTLYQTGQMRIDDSGKTPYVPSSSSSSAADGLARYTLTTTLTPSFKWKSGTKPTTEAAYDAFLNEVNSSVETFEISIWVSAEYVGTGA